MSIEVVVLQRGERQEARTGNHVNAVRGATKADERCIHFPLGGGIEEGELLSLFNVAPGDHDESFRVEEHIGIAGMIEGGKLSHFGVSIPGDLDRVTIGFVEQLLGRDLADGFPFGVGLFRDQTSKLVLGLYHKRIH